MKLIDIEQGTTEWHEFRRFKIGSSMASTIMNVNPWETKLQLWERIIKNEELQETSAMSRGKKLEPKAREWFHSLHEEIKPYVPVVVQNDHYDWLIASLDGWDGSSILEIKCPGTETHVEAICGSIPSYYYPQLQHQMLVTGSPMCLYLSFDGNDGVIIPCTRDEKYIEKLLEEEIAFHKSLINFEPPKSSDRDEIEITEESLVQNAINIASLQTNINRMQIELDSLKEDLIKKCPHPRVKIGPIKLTKIIRKGSIDYSCIPELKEVNTEKYRKKPVESWRVSIFDKE